MMSFAKEIVLGKDLKLTFIAVAAIIFTAAFACQTGGDTVPPDAELQSLIKDTTSDFANAIETEDFTRLHSKASSDFQSTYTPAQAKNAFSTFIDKKDAVLPSLKNAASSNATFSKIPSIRQEKGLNILVVDGELSSKPYPVKFQYEYVWRDGGWKMLKLFVNM
ncbi:MAG TPA: hypothetical protein PKD26_02940 [Pyrinomonadaceae bacterium]|nr:hypothetical protein [Pyrinomonadaceae bacterium]